MSTSIYPISSKSSQLDTISTSPSSSSETDQRVSNLAQFKLSHQKESDQLSTSVLNQGVDSSKVKSKTKRKQEVSTQDPSERSSKLRRKLINSSTKTSIKEQIKFHKIKQVNQATIDGMFELNDIFEISDLTLYKFYMDLRSCSTSDLPFFQDLFLELKTKIPQESLESEDEDEEEEESTASEKKVKIGEDFQVGKLPEFNETIPQKKGQFQEPTLLTIEEIESSPNSILEELLDDFKKALTTSPIHADKILTNLLWLVQETEEFRVYEEVILGELLELNISPKFLINHIKSCYWPLREGKQRYPIQSLEWNHTSQNLIVLFEDNDSITWNATTKKGKLEIFENGRSIRRSYFSEKDDLFTLSSLSMKFLNQADKKIYKKSGPVQDLFSPFKNKTSCTIFLS